MSVKDDYKNVDFTERCSKRKPASKINPSSLISACFALFFSLLMTKKVSSIVHIKRHTCKISYNMLLFFFMKIILQ